MKRLFTIFGIFVFLIIGGSCATTNQSVPSSFEGFVGSLEGRVVSVHHGAFVMRVNHVVQVREDNQAPRPGAIRNHRIVIHSRRFVDDHGEHRPVALHQSFINSLSSGETITLRVRHEAGNQLSILELTEQQQEQAEF